MGNRNLSCECVDNIGHESIIIDSNIFEQIKNSKEDNSTNKREIKDKIGNKKGKINNENKSEIITELNINNINKIEEKKEKIEEKKKDEMSRQSSDKVYTDISNRNSEKKNTNKINKPKNYKTILIYGEHETGKTSFVLKVCNNKFDIFYIPSFSDEKTTKNLILNSKNFNIEFIVSNETSIIKESDLYLIFYDLTSIESYNKAKNLIIEKIYKMNQPIFLIGNKSDLRNKINIPDLKDFSQKYCFDEVKISIKDSIGVSSLLKKFGEIFNYDND